MAISIDPQVDKQSQYGGNDLADDSGNGSTGNPHGGKAKIPKDQNGIQYDIDDSTGSLSDHAIKALARGLQ